MPRMNYLSRILGLAGVGVALLFGYERNSPPVVSVDEDNLVCTVCDADGNLDHADFFPVGSRRGMRHFIPPEQGGFATFNLLDLHHPNGDLYRGRVEIFAYDTGGGVGEAVVDLPRVVEDEQ
jgi:hypothetical protein